MAKLAVVFFAAFAFHAVFAGVIQPYQYTNTIQELTGYGSPMTNLRLNEFQGQETTQELLMQIERSTLNLIKIFRGSYINVDQIRIALREYAQNVEAIVNQLESIRYPLFANSIVKSKIQEITNQFRQILTIVMQLVNIQTVQNVDVLKMQLSRNWEIIAQELKPVVNCPEQATVQNILYNYLTAVEQLTMQIQKGNPLQWLVNYGQPMFNKNAILNRLATPMLENQYTLNDIPFVIRDITNVIESIDLDNVPLRQTITRQLLGYIQILSTIVENLNQVKYQGTVQFNTIQPLISNLREIIVSLQRICENDAPIMPVQQWKRQVSLNLQNLAAELQRLPISGPYDPLVTKTPYHNTVNEVFNQFLMASRNLQLQLLNFFYYPQQERTPAWYGIQFQTLANGLGTTLKSIHPENVEVRRFLTLQCRELAQQLEYIINRLQVETTNNIKYGVPVNTQITNNLKQIVNTLQRLSMTESFTDLNQLKMQIVYSVQEAATEVQKLLWARVNYPQEKLDTVLDEVCKQFLATLRNYQIQMQSLFLTEKYGQNLPQMINQIQAMTNGLAVFLQNTPFQAKEVETQIRRLEEFLNFVIYTLETEMVSQTKLTSVNQIVQNFKQIVVSLKRYTKWENTDFGVNSQLYLVLQNVGVEFKRLAMVCESEVQIEENLIPIARSVFTQYFVLLQRIQLDLQSTSYMQQMGQTPTEVSVYIQNVVNILDEIITADYPINQQTYKSLLWQVRRFYQLLTNIVQRLQVETPQTYGKVNDLQEVIFNINRIRLVLQKLIQTNEVLDVQQFKEMLSTCIRDSATEIQKLTWLNEFTAETKKNHILNDFLAVLQNFQLQLQDDLQIELEEQNPRSLVLQIQAVATRLFACIQWIRLQPPTQQLRETLTIQVGQLAQTIENLLPMLRTEMGLYRENVNVLQKEVAQFTQVLFDLQEITRTTQFVDLNELCDRVLTHIQNVVSGMEQIAWVAEAKIENTKLSYKGVLQGAFNNCLATLWNMLNHLENTQKIGQYNGSVNQLADQVHTTTNKLTTTMENVWKTGNKHAQQAFLIEIIKYASRVQLLVNRLEKETNFVKQYNPVVFRQVFTQIRNYLISVEKLSNTLATTMNTIETENYLNNYILKIDSECQKLLSSVSELENRQPYNALVRSILVEYLTILQNLQVRVEYIWNITEKEMSLPELAIQIRHLAKQLIKNLKLTTSYNPILKRLTPVETTHMTIVIKNIINKLQVEISSNFENKLIFQQVASQLKEVQKGYEQNLNQLNYNEAMQSVTTNVNLAQQAAIALEKLAWNVQPKLEERTGTFFAVRDILDEFVGALQNWTLQLMLVNFNGQPNEFETQLNTLGSYSANYKLQSLLYPQQVYQSPKSIINEVQGQYGQYGYASRVSGYYNREYPEIGRYNTVLPGGKHDYNVPVNPEVQTSQELIRQINSIVTRVIDEFSNVKQDKNQFLMQSRELLQVIDNVIDRMQVMIANRQPVSYTYIQQVISNLRQSQVELRRIASTAVMTTTYQIKSQFIMTLQTIAREFQQLVNVVQNEPELTYAVKDILTQFYMYLRNICNQCQYNYEYYPVNYERSSSLWNENLQSLRNYPTNKYPEYNYYSLPSSNYEKSSSQYKYGYQPEGIYENKYQSPLNLYLPYRYGYKMPSGNEYALKDQKCEELVQQIRWVAKQVVNELEIASNEKQVQDLFVLQARQMIGVIDSIIEKLQVQIPGANPIVKQVIINLRQIQAQLRSIVMPGAVVAPAYQIRTQLVDILESIVTEFQELVNLVKTDFEVSYVVKDVLVRYLSFIRGMYYQCRRNLENMETAIPSMKLDWYNNAAVGNNLLNTIRY